MVSSRTPGPSGRSGPSALSGVGRGRRARRLVRSVAWVAACLLLVLTAPSLGVAWARDQAQDPGAPPPGEEAAGAPGTESQAVAAQEPVGEPVQPVEPAQPSEPVQPVQPVAPAVAEVVAQPVEPEAPPPAPTATATVTVTAVPTATPVPGGPTGLEDRGREGAGRAGETVTYRHTVRHLAGELPDAKELEVVSALGWRVELLAADGVTRLVDTTGDGRRDTGAVPVGGWVEIVVAVAIPAGAAPGAQDATRLTAASAGAPGRAYEADVTDATTVLPPPPTAEPGAGEDGQDPTISPGAGVPPAGGAGAAATATARTDQGTEPSATPTTEPAPGGPSDGEEPSGPDPGGDPDGPDDDANDPDSPGNPGDAGDPGDANDPGNAGDSGDANDPGDPGDPGDPADPANPDGAGADGPAEPAEGSEPAAPGSMPSAGTPGGDPAGVPAAGPLAVTLSEGETRHAGAGETVDYRHTVANVTAAPGGTTGGGTAAVVVSAASLVGWPVAVLAADGVTPLGDADGDGAGELGTLGPGESRAFVVRISVPAGVSAGLPALTTVEARAVETGVLGAEGVPGAGAVTGVDELPGTEAGAGIGTAAESGAEFGTGIGPGMPGMEDGSNVDAAVAAMAAVLGPELGSQPEPGPATASGQTVDVTTVALAPAAGPPAVTVAMAAGGFGAVGPDGRTTPGGPASTVDAAGATYVRRDAVTVAVTGAGDGAWSVACGIEVAAGALASPVEWRVAGTGEWRAFEAGETVCLSGEGDATVTLDLRIRVEWTDPVGEAAWSLRFGL